MALPVVIPNTFANANASIPLSQLDNNFSTVAVAINGMANGAESLSNVNITGGSIANASLSNVSISSGNVTINVANVTTLDATNVEVTNIKAKDGTASATIADSTGVMTIASSVLTTADINGGTIDNAAIGATTPNTGAFTTLSASGNQTQLGSGSASGTNIRFWAGSGLSYVGVDSSAGGTLATGSSPYAVVLAATGTEVVQIAPSSSVMATFSSTGLAVTGALTTTGNVGIGVTPSAWSGITALQVKNASISSTAGNNSEFDSNVFYDGANYKYISNGYATAYQQYNGTHKWQIAPSGTAGNAITFTQAMTLDASGNLGIGTTSPAQRLDVRTTSGNAYVGVGRASQSTGQVGLTLYGGTSGTDWIIYQPTSSNNLTFYGNGSDQVVITSGGNVGIGTSSPTQKLDVSGKIRGYLNNTSVGNASSAQFVQDGTGDAAISFLIGATTEWLAGVDNSDSDSFKISNITGGGDFTSTGLTLTTTGKVGIGVTNPSALLDVRGSAPYMYVSDTVGANKATFVAEATNTVVNVGSTYLGAAAVPLALVVGGTERARITSAGELLVGGTNVNPWADTTGTGTTAIWKNRLFVSSDSDCGAFNRIGSDGTIYSFNRSGSGVGTISVTTTATAYNTSSDYRLKNVTGPIKNSGAYIDSLNPVEGTWKADGSPFVGLIAHEVQEVSRTQVVTGEKDGEEMQGMDYSNAEIIANLIAEVKSLRSRIAALEAQ